MAVNEAENLRVYKYDTLAYGLSLRKEKVFQFVFLGNLCSYSMLLFIIQKEKLNGWAIKKKLHAFIYAVR